jgi:CRP/FNR family transcriptional regulator, cyclic AMP receptor protein
LAAVVDGSMAPKTVSHNAAAAQSDRAIGAGTAGILLAESSSLVGRPQSLMDRLAPEDRLRVRSIGTERQLNRSEVLLSQGQYQDGIALVESGLIRSFYTAPSGRQITLAYWHPGNFVGGPHIFGGSCIWSAVAARRSVVICLPGEGLRDLARQIPDLALQLLDALSFKARCYSSLAQMLGTRSLSERLVQVLVHLIDTHGIPEPNGQISVAAAFSHAEIANLIGATRQWVTISLNRLQKRGIISQKRGMMVISKPDMLRHLTGDEL